MNFKRYTSKYYKFTMNKNNYLWIFIAFICLQIIITTIIIILEILYCIIGIRNRRCIIISDTDTNVTEYSISVNEETKEAIHVQIAENV